MSMKNALRFGRKHSWCPAIVLLFAVIVARPLKAQDGPMPPAPAPQAEPPKPTDSGNGSGADRTPVAVPAPDLAAATPQPAAALSGAKIMVPSGTHIPLVLHNAISTRSARPGDPVYFETLYPVMIDGQVVIPAGSYMSGEVTESKRAGHVKGRAELSIKLTSMILPNAYQVNLNAVPSGAGTGGNETTNSEGQIVGDSDKMEKVATVAKTTAAGAGIGGLATQSGRGVGIGAGIGAAAGLAAVLLTRGPEAELPRGSTVEAVIDRSLYLDADKVKFTGPGQASALPGPANREPVRNKNPF
jgi:type IV secretion system protein VirB10